MMQNNFKIYFLIFIASLFFLTGFNHTLADQVGISIDQSVFAFDASPGENQNFTFNIKNISRENQKVFFEASDENIGDNNSIVFGDNAENGLKKWINADIPPLSLKSGEEREVAFTLKIPENAVPGSHFGAILVRSMSDSQNSDGPKINGRVAVHVLVNVKGTVHGEGNISYFYTPIITGKKFDITAQFENNGNVHYIPYGEIILKNLITKKETKTILDKHFVFPGKKYTFSIAENLPSLFGAYIVKASFIDGEGKIHLAKRYLVAKYFPIIGLVSIIGFIFLVRFIIKSRKNNTTFKEQK